MGSFGIYDITGYFIQSLCIYVCVCGGGGGGDGEGGIKKMLVDRIALCPCAE